LRVYTFEYIYAHTHTRIIHEYIHIYILCTEVFFQGYVASGSAIPTHVWKERYILKTALYVLKGAVHILERDPNVSKKALFNLKRALHMLKGTLCFLKKALYILYSDWLRPLEWTTRSLSFSLSLPPLSHVHAFSRFLSFAPSHSLPLIRSLSRSLPLSFSHSLFACERAISAALVHSRALSVFRFSFYLSLVLSIYLHV